MTNEIERREFVKQMANESWNVYVQNAWGDDGVEPVSQKPIKNNFGWNSGQTIFASITTLWVMDLKNEFDRCKQWIEEEFDFSTVNTEVDVAITEQYYISSLLSCFALTGNEMFLGKAREIAQDMVPAYQTKYGLPNERVNLRKCTSESTSIIYLSKIGPQALEYNYLSDLKKESSKLKTQVNQMFNYMKSITKQGGLYYCYISLFDGKWPSNGETCYYHSHFFFDSLLKTFIQSNGENKQAIEMFKEAINAIDRNELFVNNLTDGHIFALDYNSKTEAKLDYMRIASSRFGAMLTLAANTLENSLENTGNNEQPQSRKMINRYKILAKKITETFCKISSKTKTGLPPYYLKFGVTVDNLDGLISDRTYYTLSPYLAESYFIMWRLTHDQKYRDYAWQLTQAIHEHCRTECGSYSEIENVNEVPTKKRNRQPFDFMSGNLKYLYLTFCEDTVLPLDQWVFSAIGNPLPIKGKNDAYKDVQQ